MKNIAVNPNRRDRSADNRVRSNLIGRQERADTAVRAPILIRPCPKAQAAKTFGGVSDRDPGSGTRRTFGAWSFFGAWVLGFGPFTLQSSETFS